VSDVQTTLLQALAVDPADDTAWLALADHLEEQGQPERGELIRLTRRLREAGAPRRDADQALLQTLLLGGTTPCVPVLTNSIGMHLALVPAGTFQMGSPGQDRSAWQSERPQHPVTISRPFYLGIFPVTQAEYRRVMGTNPSCFAATGTNRSSVRRRKTDTFPVENLSWDDSVAFCEALSKLPEEQEAGRVYRLPTEAEWEYACRAGTTSRYHFGATITSEVANFDGKLPFDGAVKGPSLGRTSAAGSYPPNAWGLYDMHGNVWEWCSDWWDGHYYEVTPHVDPPGPESGHNRVLRGGSWKNDGFYLRSAHRGWSTRDNRIGFRVLLHHANPPPAGAISAGPVVRKARRRGGRRAPP
jgi:uncharacterized protein (TIGR02996 family)